MNWARTLILMTTILYALTALASLWERNYKQALIFAGYTIANLGFLMV